MSQSSDKGISPKISGEDIARIGASISILRPERKNWTQRGLARAAGISKRSVVKIESCEFDFEKMRSAISAICVALDITLDELLEYSERELLPRDAEMARKKLDATFD